MMKRLRAVTVCVRDQQRALGFYTDTLGFEKRLDASMGPDARWIEVAPRGAQTALVLYTPPGMEGRIGTATGMVIECDDVYATATELRRRGVELVEEPNERPWGQWAQFRDPDGNVFGLVKPR